MISLTARARRKTVDLALRDKRHVRANPGLVVVEVFEGVLFLVLPLHVALFVVHGVPPDVEDAVGPVGAADEEGAEVEAAAVLGDDHVDGGGEIVADGGAGGWVEVGGGEGVLEGKGVVFVDVAVGVGG